ncbi:MAG: 2-hydroxychromene-2-carboxylate isomerase [Burkholderiales bacterium]|jgi:2-hydroxychromene-2-carboxylate isomerase
MTGDTFPDGPTRFVDCYYSVRSIYAYFGARRAAELARRFGRRLRHRPIDLSKVVPAAGGVPFAQRNPRQRAYQFGREVERWSEWLELPVIVEPVHHYGDRDLPSGLVLVAQREGLDVDRLSEAILAALWRDDRDIADPAVLASIAAEVDLDAGPLLARARDADVMAEFAACTDDAIRLGVPGSPTYVVDGELFYGQDRLMFVERELAAPFGRSGRRPST